ncbi:MAG: class I SAM-dependent DNA methyltransferase [Bacillota bacterium]
MSAQTQSYKESFARIYDKVMSPIPYRLWYSYIHLLLDYHNFKTPGSVLELACGTGNMMVHFIKDEIPVDGLDASEEMLKIARNKLNGFELEPEFYHRDFLNIPEHKSYDLVYSIFDSLNYVLDTNELKEVFIQVKKVLQPHGCFIFDLNTRERLISIEPGTTKFFEDDFVCYWQDIVYPEEGIWQARLSIQFDGEGDKYEEIHTEKGYHPEEVKRALLAAGYTSVYCYRSTSFSRCSYDDDRVYFVASLIKTNKSIFLKRIFNRLKLFLYKFYK